MAGDSENKDREDLSEEASPHRLLEFREKGRVSQSRELSGFVVLLGCAVTLMVMMPHSGQAIGDYMRKVFTVDIQRSSIILGHDGLYQVLMGAMLVLAKIVLPVACVGFVLGALASFAQIGPVFSSEPLTPDLERVNPLKGFQKMFAMKQVYDALRLLLKGVALAGVAYFLAKSHISASPSFILSEPGAMMSGFSQSGKSIFFTLSVFLLAFAGLDYWIQRWDFSKSVRLTRKEQKEEHREHEGDPLIRARIRSVQREMARKRMMDAVKKADVIVTNPTHIAIAIVYDREKMDAPQVVAKGADFLAQQIKKIAADAHVPMVENIPLARALYKTVKVGAMVPKSLYQAVAEVLAFIYRLKNRRF